MNFVLIIASVQSQIPGGIWLITLIQPCDPAMLFMIPETHPACLRHIQHADLFNYMVTLLQNSLLLSSQSQ